MTVRYAVIPTRGDRHEVLTRCVAAILPQVSGAIIVDNSDDGRALWRYEMPQKRFGAQPDPRMHFILDPEQPPNLSRLWNLGLDHATKLVEPRGIWRWEVAVLNDDAIVPDYWFEWLANQMRAADCFAAGFGPRFACHRTPGTTDLWERMPGHAFILAGERELRADENLRWWCGDNDLDMQARKAGGTLIVPMDEVQHLHPDESTVGVLREQTGKDMAYFVRKWGFRPW